MLMMASGIASMGLSEDSAATVTGAMIVAPLGQPIVALGAAIALRMPGESVKLLGIVLLGAASVVAFGYLANMLLPTENPNGQILARTSPDFRDLAIAIFSGVAGAYGYRYRDFSGVLAGVAIAVALVPPLCVVGMMLEEGRTILAWNALVLFVTNFAGITLTAVLVFAVGKLMMTREDRGWFATAGAAVIVLNALVLIPLSLNYERVVGASINRADTYSAVTAAMIGPFHGATLTSLVINGSELRLKIDPLPTDPAAVQTFTDRVQAATGYQVVLSGKSGP
ncbi:hypothetical protein B6V73_20040 [Thioclava sp. JM3]|uniref:DUF389 domain-containing protein n=1 Tax=Thioclava sp. JM3 TaxID=1973004 RepID=UPI000B538EF8|nr:DUF389 domain-containing protein [Thioclava sp. JM3]OWY08876.1 hypothetical protein B6V73_20040 [Thioclava sp. JM3]